MENRDFDGLKRNIIWKITNGGGAPVPGWQISEATGAGGTPTIRRAINELRREGAKICSCPSGYWLAQTDDEAEATAAGLRARAVSMLQAADGMTRNKIGQINMDEYE